MTTHESVPVKLSVSMNKPFFDLQVCKLEQSLQKEKTSWQEELAALEKKLSQARSELESKNSQIGEMANSVK